MTGFTTLVSKFAHKNGESSNSSGSNGTRNDKKRAHSSIQIKTEEDTKELTTHVRKSQRTGSISTPQLLNARAVSADSIKMRPHHKRPTAEVRVKTQGRNRNYASPEVYAHLTVVADIIDYDLDVLFVGINPGVKSSERSHHFAGPTNHFWPCLSDSGLLPPGVRLGPNDDRSLPAICNMGLTNLVDRPSRMGDELSVAECRAAAPILTAKIKKYRPRFVCFVSKQAWDMYSGVGLGLQTAWVSWYNEVEDGNFPVLGQNDNDDDGGIYAIQNNLEAEGYRLAPYFERGPGAEMLEHELEAEGVPSPFKREDSKRKSAGLKLEPEEDKKKPIKPEVGETPPVKMEIDEKNGIKTEHSEEDVKVKIDQYEGESSSGRARTQSRANGSSESRYRGGVRGSRMFVMPSTSGRVTQYRREDKLAFFKQLAELVRKDRQVRGVKDPWEL
ncbi:hypothetical protein BGZ58_000557 [Dissophora ornata]|nr:hypothetical protein BGZ58_000557 [Dissophora ornata]